MTITSQEKLAKIFRTKAQVILEMEKKMSVITGKKNVIENLMKENQHRIKRTLDLFLIMSAKRVAKPAARIIAFMV